MPKPELDFRLNEDQKKLAEDNFRLVYWFMEKQTMPDGIDWDDYQSYLIRWYLRSIVTYDETKSKISTYVVQMLRWSRLHYITAYVREKKKGISSIHGEEGDAVEFPVWDDQDQGIVNQENRACLEKLFESIGPVREKIVRKYISGVSPTIIGRQVGISRQRVEQIIEKSVLLMRKKAKDSGIRNPMEVA